MNLLVSCRLFSKKNDYLDILYKLGKLYISLNYFHNYTLTSLKKRVINSPVKENIYRNKIFFGREILGLEVQTQKSGVFIINLRFPEF